MSKKDQKMNVLSRYMKTSSIQQKGQQLDNMKKYEQNPSTLESSSITPIEPYFDQKAQQEKQETIKKLESICHQKETKIENLQKELKSEKQRCKQEKGKAEKAEEQTKKTKQQLQRTKYQLDQYRDKVFKYQEKNNSLKAYVREQSYQYKNLVSKHLNLVTPLLAQKIHHQTEKDYEVETLRKILNFYESINEGQIDPKKMSQFIQEQQHDILILQNKIMEKQEAFNNRIRVLEQQRKIYESQTALKSNICDKIEYNLKSINQEDRKLYEICMEVNSENLRLRQNLEELRKFVQPLSQSQKNINEYVQRLEEVILQYSSEINNSKTLEKAPPTIHHQSQLLQAKIAKIQAQLKQARSQINDLKQYQSKSKRLQHSQKQLMAQLSEYKAHSQKQAESIHENLADIEKCNAQLSAERERVEKLYKQIEIAKSVNNQNRGSKLASSEILIDLKHAKELIIQQIQAFEKKQIRKSEVVFREDKYHHSFGIYLSESFPLLLLVQINQTTLFGAYSSYFLADGNSKDSFLFTFDKNGKLKTYFKHSGRQSSKSISYSDNSLIFGYNEVRLCNNSKNYEMNIATNIFGSRHYNLPSKLTEFEGMINNNKISYTNMEIHKIRY